MKRFFLKFINFSDSSLRSESKALIIKYLRFFATLRMTKSSHIFSIFLKSGEEPDFFYK
jgi:hypothetical protein